jgi:hypothetical protein
VLREKADITGEIDVGAERRVAPSSAGVKDQFATAVNESPSPKCAPFLRTGSTLAQPPKVSTPPDCRGDQSTPMRMRRCWPPLPCR